MKAEEMEEGTFYTWGEEERRTHNSWKTERKGPQELEKRKTHWKSWRDEEEVDVSASVCQLVRTSQKTTRTSVASLDTWRQVWSALLGQ